MPDLRGAAGAAAFAHRHDVDGLRAVAVLAILGFHLGVAGFGGGFIGVDVFFVISGYVILRSILPELESDRFSLADFFMRRIRRLLPALMVVLLATLAAGFLILAPAELEELAGSALATLAFGANIFFHDRTGYFASEAHTRPLLHMWSLGVEEQFYLLVPLALAALIRFRGIAPTIPLLALAIGSFAYCVIAAAAVHEAHAFYMPMARFWEIAVGGCVAVAERRWSSPRRGGTDWLAALGIVAIGGSVVLLDSDAGGQRWAILAVLGSAAVIVAGTSGRGWTAAALAARPMVAIGRISYSIYLVHWPLIVLWRLYAARPLLPLEQALIALLTLALALALSVFVETPMRAGSRWIGNRAALRGVGAAGALVAAIGGAILLDRGANWRLQAPAREALAMLRIADTQRPRCRADDRFLAFRTCRWNGDSPNTDFVIWGDSHARALAPELSAFLVGAGYTSGVYVGLQNCPPAAGVAVIGRKSSPDCSKPVEAVLQAIALHKPRIVVLTSRWANFASDMRAPGDGTRSGHLLDTERDLTPITLADAVLRTVKRVREAGALVVLVGPVPEIDYDVPATLARSLHGVGSLPPVKRRDFDLRQRQVLSALAMLEGREGVVVVYPHTILCNLETCAVADGTKSYYVDDDHLSPFASARVAALIGSAIARTRVSQARSSAALVAAPIE